MSIFAAILWVFATSFVAMLPVERHYLPGRILLLLAPVLLIWLGWEHGWGAVAFGLFAVASMYRRPIRYYWAKLRQKKEDPS
ncbi:DUF2484 family protein [Pseudophaeobacter sp.]|uniref:DUF2484 family protein n=1 Tax=Pseudophaeobacter sp. TaxID=1971739 RepID=UPI004057D7D1